MLRKVFERLTSIGADALKTTWQDLVTAIEKEDQILDALKQMLPVERLNFLVDGAITYHYGPKNVWYETDTSTFFQRLCDAIYDAVGVKSPKPKLTSTLQKLITDSSQPWSYKQFKNLFPKRFGEAVTASGPFPHPMHLLTPSGLISLRDGSTSSAHAHQFIFDDWDIHVSLKQFTFLFRIFFFFRVLLICFLGYPSFGMYARRTDGPFTC